MSGTTSLDDLPINGGEQDKQMVNEIVSGIQQASMNGGLDLPNRDIPMNTSNVNSDVQIQPDYVPKSDEDYITSHETSETVLKDAKLEENRTNNFNYLYDKAHIFILIGFMYFIFQLPVFSKMMLKYLPFCFGDDKNLNLQGTIIKSIIFAGILFVQNETISFVSNM
tara:strand:+ start:487 stop:987 length:501 start_codon:yes stop_codon:yes gene_type:complete